MRKLFFALIIGLCIPFSTYSQKFAYIDTDYILNNIPAYQTAKEKIDKLSSEWQKEIENKMAEIEKLYKDYQSEKVLLSDEMQTKKENEIITKEKQVKELQKKYFGKDGELFKKRQEFVKPIQDEIFNAVKEIATQGTFSIIFDISGSAISILYTDPKFDKSDEVLEKLGYKK